MYKIIRIILILTASLGFSLSVLASKKKFVFEPYLGTEYGSWGETQVITSGSTQTTYDLSGYSLGYLLGGKVLYISGKMFLIGVDYNIGGGSRKYSEDESSSIDDNFEDVSMSKSSGGLVLGIFKKEWSFKFSFFPINNLIMEKGIIAGNNEITYSGNGLAVNFSYTVKPRINLNFEYVSNSYDTIEINGSSGDLPGDFSGVTYRDLSNSSYRIYLSFPF